MLRESYKPEEVGVATQTLMIGESRPNGGTFFYAGNSILFSSIKEAFAEAFGPSASRGSGFLKQYQHSGFYLVDLCDEPVNHLKDDPRRLEMRKRSEGRLAGAITVLPKAARIVILMKAIEANVE